MENNTSFSTPILFITFNRPDTTARVFEAIRNIRPSQLYIAADGPRLHKDGEKELCAKTREITEAIDWPCEVFRKYEEKNLGCKIGASSAITWFFKNVEEGIILEDDCVPDPSFFIFCQELLERYRNVDKVKMISGDNFQFGKKYGEGSYYFSRFLGLWGWASWRRAWEFDSEMKGLEEFIVSKELKSMFKDKKMLNFWINHHKHVKDKNVDTWDVQWSYAILKNNGVTIMPNINLVSNIGFGDAATHTKKEDGVLNDIPAEKIENIVHPKLIIVSEEADSYLFYKIFYKSIFERIVTKIKSL